MTKLWNKMLRIGKDKLWHFILLNQITAVLLAYPVLILYVGLALPVLALIFFWNAEMPFKLVMILGACALFSSFVFFGDIGRILLIVIGLSVGKELYDWYHGQYVDFGDLLADFLGIGLAILT